MVLFFDDIQEKPPTKRHKYLRRTIKVILLLGVLLGISLWVLSSLGGNSKALRLGIQDYLADSTGYLAEMGTLNSMSFFPVARLDFSDLALYRPVKKEEDAKTDVSEEDQKTSFPQQKTMADYFDAGEQVASVKSTKIAMKFWDMFLTRRRFIELEITGLKAEAGVWMPQAVNIESLKVVPDAATAAIIVTGTYGPHTLDAKIALQTVKLPSGVTLYEIPDTTNVDIKLGPVTLEGAMKAPAGQAVNIDIKKLNVAGLDFTGTLLFKGGGQKAAFKADLRSGHSHLLADIKTTPTGVTGTVTMPVLDVRDVGPVRKAYNMLDESWSGKASADKVSFGARNREIKIVIEKLLRDGQEWGHAKADLLTKPYELHVANLSGLIGGGALKGDIAINATGKVPSLKSDLHLRGWDYARVQSTVTGQADTHLVLSAEGKTFDDLQKNIKGELLTVAGAGELSGGSALYWGGGLLNVMLPGFSAQEKMKVNCVVADLDISGGGAKVQTLFMDFSDLTIRGEGTMRIDDMVLDMQLKPYPKEASIIDTGVAVTLRGTLADPKITPEKWSMGKKLGGLFLGTINPAFFAFSLTDLGLNESHPCHAYIKQP